VLVRSWSASARARIRQPAPGRRYLVLAVLVGGWSLLLYAGALAALALIGDGPVDPVQPVGPVLGGCTGALLAPALARWGRRRRARAPERARLRPIRTATRTGRLPREVDPALWAPVLVRERLTHRRRMVVVLVVEAVVALAVLGVLLVRTDTSVGVALLWTAMAGQVMSLVWSAGQRHQRRIAGLLERLSGAATVGGPAGH
jgi:membrane protein DedA with SNARE-associated domain